MWTRWFSTVCPLNGCCKEESACHYTEYQRICETLRTCCEAEISSAKSNAPVSHLWWQSWYLRNCESLHTEGRLGRCCTGLLLRFVVQCRFAYEAWPSTGRGVARASRIRENKNRENFFWRIWTLFHENLHQRKFPAIRYSTCSFV